MRAALFDLDETILDRTGSLRDFASWQATEVFGASIICQDKFVERFIELDQNGMIWKDKVYESLINEFHLENCTVDTLLNTYLKMFCTFCKPRNGANEAIEAFHRKSFKIGLVSNGKTPFQERNFHALGFYNLFDCVIVSEAVGLRKPERAIFELACRAVGADIYSSVFIGDNPVADMKGAKDAGMTTIHVPIDSNQLTCEFADKTFYELTELGNHINQEY